MHIKDIYEKQSKKRYDRKNYTFNDGKIVKVQGYEPFAIELLELQGYNSNDIEIESLKIS